jgi:hypothetical protein
MEKTQLKNILIKIGEVNSKYNLGKQVYNNGKLIQFIDNPSEEVQLAAVKKLGSSIQYIQNPSERVQLAAVKDNPSSIQYIQNPSEKIQLVAVKQNPYSIYCIKNPTEGVKQLYRKKTGIYIPSDSISKKIITRIGKFFGSPS